MATILRLDDVTDGRLHDYTNLRDVNLRRRLETDRGLYLAEGEKVIRRAVAAGHEPRSFLLAPRWLESLAGVLDDVDAPCFVLDEATIESLTGFHVHRGALAAVNRPAPLPPEQVVEGARRIVVLEDLADHTNVGAAFRAAAALGADAVLVTPRCADPLYRRAIKVSMGTVFSLPWARIDPWPGGLDLLRDRGFTVAGLALEPDAMTLDELVADLPEHLAWVVGSEGHGLQPETMARTDRTVMIPMSHGVDSLNAASSLAVALWATRPQGDPAP